mgnify:CR=1 FL=1
MKKGVDKVGVRVYYMQALWGAGPEQVKNGYSEAGKSGKHRDLRKKIKKT